jgi:hypothetical protein
MLCIINARAAKENIHASISVVFQTVPDNLSITSIK